LYAKKVHPIAAVFVNKLPVGVAVHDGAMIGLIQKKTLENSDYLLVVVIVVVLVPVLKGQEKFFKFLSD
jgi:hypothetical protein